MDANFYRHLEVGHQFFSVGNYQRAAGEFEAALAIKPEDNSARIHLVHCWVRLDRLEDARREVAIALKNEPDNAEAHYIASYTTEKWKVALSSIETALALDPENAGYHKHRGYILTRLDRFQEAIQSIRYALELEPDSATIHRQMADTLFDEAERKRFVGKVSGLSCAGYKEVAFHVERALELEPENARSQAVRARLKSFDLDHEASLQGWQESLRLNPTEQYAQYQLRIARTRAQKAKFQERCWRVLYRWMPWPVRLPLTWGVMVVSLWKGIVVGRTSHFWLDEPLLFIGIGLFAAFQTELLLRDWLRFVPERYLGKSLRPLKKPPLR